MLVVSSRLRAGSGGIPAASFDSRPALWQQGAASGSPQEGTLKCPQAYPPLVMPVEEDLLAFTGALAVEKQPQTCSYLLIYLPMTLFVVSGTVGV